MMNRNMYIQLEATPQISPFPSPSKSIQVDDVQPYIDPRPQSTSFFDSTGFLVLLMIMAFLFPFLVRILKVIYFRNLPGLNSGDSD
jgi:hypothetical protein